MDCNINLRVIDLGKVAMDLDKMALGEYIQ